MNISSENWKDINLNLDSLWIIGPRAKGGKRENNYHGNFAPQIPNDLIQRFTIPGDVVLDMFMGSGTTLYECESLGRNFIGIDINSQMLEYVKSKMVGTNTIDYNIHDCNILDGTKIQEYLEDDLKRLNRDKVDLIISHPPYLDIIKFTDKAEDLSQITDIDAFIDTYLKSVHNVWDSLKKKGYFVLVIGDIYKKSEVVPLSFYLMDALKKTFKCLLKGIVIKDIVGNRAKIGTEAIYRYRALKFGYYLFKHEYVFVFQKK